MAQKVHPNLFEFIEVIQKEQATAEVTIEQLSGAGGVRAKQRNVVRHEETIKKLTEEFTGGVRTLELFIDLITYLLFYVLISQAVRNIKFNTVRTFS